jgi:hypothetical protein
MMPDEAPSLAVMSQVLKIEDADSFDYCYKMMRADARPDLFRPRNPSFMSYEDQDVLSIPLHKLLDLSLIQELKAELR